MNILKSPKALQQFDQVIIIMGDRRLVKTAEPKTYLDI